MAIQEEDGDEDVDEDVDEDGEDGPPSPSRTTGARWER
jgi:hypothetical protein